MGGVEVFDIRQYEPDTSKCSLLSGVGYNNIPDFGQKHTQRVYSMCISTIMECELPGTYIQHDVWTVHYELNNGISITVITIQIVCDVVIELLGLDHEAS